MDDLPETPKHLTSADTAEEGAEDVARGLRRHGVVSFNWPQEKDKGIDLVCFVVDEEQATSFVFGVQVKSGVSFSLNGGAKVPVGIHRDYWKTSTMPVFVASPQNGLVYVEDAYSALTRDASSTSIACTTTLGEAIAHMRMRARAHALAPELSAVIRLVGLAEAITLSPEESGGAFHQVTAAYRRLESRHLEPELALAMADLVLWTRRHNADKANIESYLKNACDATSFLTEVADALAQLALVAGCQEAARSADEATRSLLEQIGRLEVLLAYLLTVWAPHASGGRKDLDTIVGRSLDTIMPGEGLHLPACLLKAMEAEWGGCIHKSVHAGVERLKERAGSIVADTRSAVRGTNPPPGTYARMFHLLVVEPRSVS